MPGKVIGTTLPLGFAGNVSRMSDNVIVPYKYDIAHASDGNIQFGEPVALDTTNGGIRKLTADDANGNVIIGLAVRRLGQPKADNANGWYYEPGETVDVLVRGSMSVELHATTGIALGGQVYAIPSTQKLTSVSTSNLAVPNCIFGTGVAGTDKIAEVTITKRSV